MKNIHYKTRELSEFYKCHRIGWDSLYPSEKVVFDHVGPNKEAKVLDMGCACGGLGVSLREKYGIENYTGIDINEDCIKHAPGICPTGKFRAGDFLEMHEKLDKDFDLGVSLSCADWNVRTQDLMMALFSHIRDGGSMLFSCRLSNTLKGGGVAEARQKILLSGAEVDEVEYAPYKVYSLEAVLRMLTLVGPVGAIYGYGYWGNVPVTVEGLHFTKAFYMVFAISKDASCPAGKTPRMRLEVDADFLMAHRRHEA